jgi:hypothetical protein
MHMHHSSVTFTISERRLCYLMPPGPEGTPVVEQLARELKSTEAKEALNTTDVTLKAQMNANLRSVDAARRTDAVRTQMGTVLQAEFRHLTAPAPGGMGKTAAEAITDINATLQRAGVNLFRAGPDASDPTKIAIIDGPAVAPPAAPRPIPARYNAVPGVPDLLNTLPVDQRNAIVDTLATLDTDAAQRQVEAFMTGFRGLTPARQQMALQRLLTGTYPPGRTAEDNRALTPVEAMIADPRHAINRIASALRAAITAPVDAAEAPEKARTILNDARTAYGTARDNFNRERTPKSEAEMIFIREKTMGQLMLMGIDVSNEEGLLTTTPMPRVEMLQVTQQWEMILHKFMGAMRLGMAVMNKVKGKLPEASGGPTGGAPENTPERLKTAGIDKLKVKAPNVAKVPAGTPIDNADPNNTVYKFTKGAVAREYRFNGTEWQVKKGPTDADWTKNTADAGVLIVGAGTPPAALTPDQTEINTFTRDILTVPAAPGAAPAAAPADDATKERLKTESDAKYAEVTAEISGPNFKNVPRAKIDAAITALEAENRVSNLDAGRKTTVENNLKEVKTFIKCLEVFPKYDANTVAYTNYKNALNGNPPDRTAIQNAALDCINKNTEELAVLNSATDWRNTPLTTKFIGGATRENRISALNGAIAPTADYAKDQADPMRRFNEKANANRGERLNQITALMANPATLGVGGITTVRQQNETHWKIDLNGYFGNANWMHVGYDRNTASFTVGLTSSENDAVPWNADLAGDFTNASISNSDGRRQANEIQAKLRDIQNRLPIDPAVIRLSV